MARHAMLQRTLVKVPPNPRSTFLYFPTPLKSLPRPAEVLQSPTTPGGRPAGSLRRAAETPGEGLGEARKGLRKLLLEKAWGKPAKGRGDYSWRMSAGSLRRRRKMTAKWRKLAAEWLRSGCEVAQTGCGVAAKWREVAAKGQCRAIPGQYLGNTWALPGQLVAVTGS